MWLGIDVGTGGTRALLVDAQGHVHAGFTAPHEDIRMERPLWAEQRPENWWDAARQAIRGVLAGAGIAGAKCKASSFRPDARPRNSRRRRRSHPSRAHLVRSAQPAASGLHQWRLGRDNILKYTANPVLTGFTLPKLLWCAIAIRKPSIASAICCCPKTTCATNSPANSPPMSPTHPARLYSMWSRESGPTK